MHATNKNILTLAALMLLSQLSVAGVMRYDLTLDPAFSGGVGGSGLIGLNDSLQLTDDTFVRVDLANGAFAWSRSDFSVFQVEVDDTSKMISLLLLKDTVLPSLLLSFDPSDRDPVVDDNLWFARFNDFASASGQMSVSLRTDNNIPEPTTLGLLGVGLLGLIYSRRTFI